MLSLRMPLQFNKASRPLKLPLSKLSKAVLISIGVLMLMQLSPIFRKPSSTQVVVNQYKPTVTPTQLPASPTPAIGQNIKTFTSLDLDISFTYNGNSLWDGKPVQVKEIGDRVYLYVWNTKPEDGRFVEVFSKDPKDSLPDAIIKRFLQGYSIQDCQVTAANLAKIYYDRNGFVYAQIRPVEPLNKFDSLPQLTAKCPPVYATINSLKYFLMDTAHPDKLVFFNIGQDTIDSGRTGELLSWDQTIQFLEKK